MITSLIIFLITYILMLVLSKYKHYIALFSAILFIILNYISIKDALLSVDYNILMMLFGIMGTVSLFIDSKMPSVLSDKIIEKAPNVKWLTILLALFSGVISAFVDNVATVLMIAPVAITIAKKIKVSPVPIVISISIFSNLEGAATLVGDTTSIMLAGAMKLDFLDFFWYENRIGLFFIVQFGLLAALLVLAFLQRKNTTSINADTSPKVEDYSPTILLILTILTLIVASFIQNKPDITNGLICLIYFIIGLIIKVIKNKNINSIINNIKEIDYSTLLLLASLFVIIGAINKAGVINYIGELFTSIGSNNTIMMYTLITFASVLISAFIDNIPYVATMLPVVSCIATTIGVNPVILYYGLIIGSTLGGNITPIGASANITAIGILRKQNYEVKNSEYFKYSIPISIAAILTGYIFVLILF